MRPKDTQRLIEIESSERPREIERLKDPETESHRETEKEGQPLGVKIHTGSQGQSPRPGAKQRWMSGCSNREEPLCHRKEPASGVQGAPGPVLTTHLAKPTFPSCFIQMSGSWAPEPQFPV